MNKNMILNLQCIVTLHSYNTFDPIWLSLVHLGQFISFKILIKYLASRSFLYLGFNITTCDYTHFLKESLFIRVWFLAF